METSNREPDQTPVQEQKAAEKRTIDLNRLLRWSFISLGILILAAIAAIVYPYWTLSRRVDRQLAAGPFPHTFTFYSAPEVLEAGDATSISDLTGALKLAGYKESHDRAVNTFTAGENAVVVRSSPPVEIQFSKNQVSRITDLQSHRPVDRYELAPQMITNMSDQGRAKRIMVHYSDLPPVLIEAVVSAEDKRFFEHSGLDVFRIAKAVYVDFREHRKEQGASTITMQLARNLWLSRDKSWRRKVAEALITLHLERKLTKKQIFEDYCNLVYLGGTGTFSINGFGEAARAYFNKDVHNLTLTESATLAGLIQRPSYFNPVHYPERATDRRNIVLSLMRDNGFITKDKYREAIAEPLRLSPGGTELAESQYFLDIASDEAMKDLQERQPPGAAEVYTTIDLRLQHAAEKAIRDGMEQVDKEMAHSRKRGQAAGPKPQVALIALDPRTGEVKALCGGRDYSTSQLNRVLSKRPPGSVFKPFVYTAAMNTALVGGNQVFTPASTVTDTPTTFKYGNRTYTPANFKNQFFGHVTVRRALAHSLNVATVKLAESVGYGNIVDLAHRAGLNDDIKPTPAAALGAYEVTPLEIAHAYTMYANGGVTAQPAFVSTIRTGSGDPLYQHEPQTQRVLDPRVTFLMVDMLEEVIRSGTAAGVRARGFTLPAGGKTGTSHDGWFAGFTSELLCVVWVGFDDYRELGLEGAHSALPIWTEFMMNAARYKEYSDAKPFTPPPGIVKAAVDPSTGLLAGPYCPGGVSDYFIDGTQPAEQCAPQQVEVFPTAEGGEAERLVPFSQQSQADTQQSRSPVTIETPPHPVRPFQPPPRKTVDPGQISLPRRTAPPQDMPVRTRPVPDIPMPKRSIPPPPAPQSTPPPPPPAQNIPVPPSQ